jgi:tudor domain-containing protein 1/4/6/7
LNEKSSTSVIVTSIDSPFCFYIQEISEDLSQLEQKIQKYYMNNQIVSLGNPQVGMICVAKYNEDQAWYRATIKEIDHDQRIIKVFFVDYGNEDVLSMDDETINICEIKDEFKKFPAMAIKCSLHGIEPTVDCKYGSNEIVDFMFLEMNSSVLVKFIDFYEDFYYVDISYEKVN